jgi:hypothetical protein
MMDVMCDVCWGDGWDAFENAGFPILIERTMMASSLIINEAFSG